MYIRSIHFTEKRWKRFSHRARGARGETRFMYLLEAIFGIKRSSKLSREKIFHENSYRVSREEDCGERALCGAKKIFHIKPSKELSLSFIAPALHFLAVV